VSLVRYVLAGLPLLALMSCAPGTSSSQGESSPSPHSSVPATWQANWAGYSFHPSRGFVAWAGALWTVPKVSCTGAPTAEDGRTARVAVWVGLWGGPNTSQGIGDAWLPQVGTASHCQISSGFTPAYNATAQMFHQGGCNVQGDNSCKPQTLGLSVQYGDRIDAEVEYHFVGQGQHGGEYQFEYYIADLTRGTQDNGILYTAPGVLRSEVEYQGGAIVEDNSDLGGLAQFTTPVAFTKVSAGSTLGGTLPSPETIAWQMYISGHQLSELGPINNGNFQVTWKSWN